MASPFRYFRKHQKAFMAAAVLIAIFVFVAGDLVTGMIGRASSGRQDPKSTVAEWNGGSMTVQELGMLTQRRYFVSEVLKRLQITGAQRILQEGGNPTQPVIPNFIIQENETPEQVRIGVVTTRVLAEQAKDTGITVSNEMINHYLKECSFRRVNESEMITILNGVRQGPSQALLDQLFTGLRELLMGNTFFMSYTGHVRNVLPEQRWEDWQRINNRISLEVAQLPAKDFVSEVPDPSESEVLAFYELNKDRVKDPLHPVMGARLPSPEIGFKEPRRVKLNYIVADVNSLKEKLRDSVTDEEIEDYYERNKRSQFVKTGSSVSSFDESIFTDEKSEDAEESAGEDKVETPMDEEASEASDQDPPQGTSEKQEETAEPAEKESDSTEADAPADSEAQDLAAPSNEDAEEAAEPAQPTEDAAEQPDAEDSSSLSDKSLFRLAAFQADLSEDTDATEATESAGDSAEAVEEDTAGEDDEDVEYLPLLDVKDSIRDKLATDKAVQELKKIVDRIYGELRTAYNPYGTSVITARSEDKEIPAPPHDLVNLKERAAEAGLISEETVPLTMLELSETVVGRSVDYQSQNRSTTQAAFTSLQNYEPFLAQDLDANWYVISKVEDVPERVPELDEIRDEVVAAWKLKEGEKLALKQAEEFAKEARKAGGALANFFSGKSFKVINTDLFSWKSFGNTPYEMQRGPRLGEVPPLKSIGPEFMTKAFQLGDDDVAAAQNYDQSKAFVIKINRRERTKEELRELFLSEANTWYGRQVLTMYRWQNQQQSVLKELTARVGLDLDKLEAYFAEGEREGE